MHFLGARNTRKRQERKKIYNVCLYNLSYGGLRLFKCIFNELTFSKENDCPLHYFCLENPMDRGTWWSTVHAVAEHWT